MLITKEEIQNLPQINYQGIIRVVSNQSEWLSVYDELKSEKILGFDTETKPTYVKGPLNPPAIMQLATSEQVIILQLSKLKLTSAIVDILQDNTILKVGVAIKDDMMYLQRRAKFKPAGQIELASLAKEKGYKSAGLRTLCAEVLGVRLSKAMQCSAWDKSHLTHAQLVYAATDAWVSRLLYLKFTDDNFDWAEQDDYTYNSSTKDNSFGNFMNFP